MPAIRYVRRKPGGDRGAVTVEAAFALVAFVFVLALALGGVSAVLSQLRCTDAAGAAARLVARGDTDRARVVAAKIAPGADITVKISGDMIQVDVRAGPVRGLPGVWPHGEAYAITEPGVARSAS